MNEFDWRCFLEEWSRELPGSPEWMGFQPAAPEQIAAAEMRLGVLLPPSYRAFLCVTNGWAETGTFVERVLPVEAIERFGIRHAEWIDAWRWSDEYAWLDDAILVSGDADQDVILLNPAVPDAAGEYEAWRFGGEDPRRFASFQALMEGERATFQLVAAHEARGLRTPSDALHADAKLDGLFRELQETAARYRVSWFYRRDARVIEEYAQRVRALQQRQAPAAEVVVELRSMAEKPPRGEGHRKATGIIRWFLNGAAAL